MESKNNGLIIIIVILSLMVVGLGGYMVYDKFIKEDSAVNKEKQDSNTKEEEKSEYEKFLDLSETTRAESIILKGDDYEIKLTASGDIVVNAESINNMTAETKVLKSFVVKAGMTDICDGRKIVFIKEDGSISALDMDMLICGNEVELITDFGNVNNIVEAYSNVTIAATEYEPAGYSAYLKDIDGNIVDITSYLD